MRREPVLLIFTGAVVAWCGWSVYGDWNNPVRKPTLKKAGGEIAEIRIPDLTKTPTPARPDGRRDLFGEPKDTRPLPKLVIGAELPLPTPEPYPWLVPSPVPGPSSSCWHQYLRESAKPTPFEFAAAGDGGSPSAVSVPAGAPAASAPAELKAPSAEELEKRYDHLVPREGIEMFGRVKNPNKFDLKDDEPIIFQMFDVKSDRPFGSPITKVRADVLRYTFAKTVRNEMEIRKRQVKWVGGNEARIREFGLQCLEWGNEEPEAFKEAERQLRKCLELAPNDPANSLALGSLFEATFRYQEAWQLYRSMTEGAFKAHADAWVALAALEARLHLLSDARAHLEKAGTLEPQNYHPKLVLGELYLSQNRPDAALEPLEAAMRLEPGGVEGKSTRAHIRRRTAEAQLALGRLDAAAETFQKAKTVDEDDPAIASGIAAIAMLRKKPADAVAVLNAQIDRRPTAASFVTRGLAKVAAGDFAGAKTDFESAVGLDPVRDVRPLSALAYLYLRTGHSDDASQYLERALQNDPTDPYALYLQGRIQRDHAQSSAAVESLQRASLSDLGFVDALAELGLLRTTAEVTDLADADRYFAKATEEDPASAELQARRGIVQLLANQTRKARESFTGAMKIDKDHGLAKIGVALCDYLEDNSMNAKKGLRDVSDRKGSLAEYALSTLDRIETQERKEEWTDVFDGREILRAEWKQQELGAIAPHLRDGEVTLEGDYSSNGDVRVFRELPSSQFCSFELDLRCPVGGASKATNQADITVYVRKEDTRVGRTVTAFEVAVVRERTGAVKLRFKDANDDASPTFELPVTWPEGKTMHIRIERDDNDNAPVGRVLINGEVVRADLRFPRGAAGVFLLGVSAESQSGRSVSLAFDNVRIVKKHDQ